jgi:hypothetical protein
MYLQSVWSEPLKQVTWLRGTPEGDCVFSYVVLVVVDDATKEYKNTTGPPHGLQGRAYWVRKLHTSILELLARKTIYECQNFY